MILSVDSILRLVIYYTVATETPSPSWSFELSETEHRASLHIFISLNFCHWRAQRTYRSSMLGVKVTFCLKSAALSLIWWKIERFLLQEKMPQLDVYTEDAILIGRTSLGSCEAITLALPRKQSE